MNVSGRRHTPTVRLRRLAAELRALRTSAGLTREEVSERTSINSATLYRIETARVRPQRRTLLALLDTYGVADPDRRGELLGLCTRARPLEWLRAYESQLPEPYTAYISFEAEARSVRNYENAFVPGLLQTADYAAAVIRGVLPAASDEEVRHRVEARVQRQAAVADEENDPLTLWAVIDEAVIRRRVGSAGVMARQLRALVAAAARPHVTLQVIPFSHGAHPGMPGSFVVMDFPDAADPELVYVDSMAGDVFLERACDLRRYTMIFDRLRAVALDPGRSVQMIEAEMDRLDTRGGEEAERF
ncbi:MAG TPA: helix-turn-helix transcriptional regulator [Pilimelia sp.]|nr:helix-turn-helix transcriptional regulator [Pilimelia sp.]